MRHLNDVQQFTFMRGTRTDLAFPGEMRYGDTVGKRYRAS